MRKSLWIAGIVSLKIQSVFAYHGTEGQGGGQGPDLPLQESGVDNLIYVFLPFMIYSLVLNEIFQFYLDRRYAENPLKTGEDYRSFTLTGGIITTVVLLFTPAFTSLPHLSTAAFAGLMAVIVLTGLGVKEREQLMEIYEERF